MDTSVLRGFASGARVGLLAAVGARLDVVLAAGASARVEFPGVVATAAELREPHRIAVYLEERVATDYHRFYDACQVLPKGDEPVSEFAQSRLWLAEATRTVLANGLDLLIALALALLTWVDALTLPILFALAASHGAARVFVGPAMSSIAPNVVPPALLPRAIAKSPIRMNW